MIDFLSPFSVVSYSERFVALGYLPARFNLGKMLSSMNKKITGKKITESYVRSLISKNLKWYRSLNKISQLDFAQKAGLAHNFVNDIESEKKWPSAKTIAKLCSALNIEPHQFFLDKDMDKGMIDDKMYLYIDALNNSIQLALAEVTNQYRQTDDNSGEKAWIVYFYQ